MKLRQMIFDNRPELTQFGIFDNSITAMTHRAVAFMAYGAALSLFAMGMPTWLSLVLGAVFTACMEQWQHRERHGMTVSEYKMIALGIGTAAVIECAIAIAGHMGA
ncbi:hypothetical protein [Mariprofundus ferrooxydans]|uniref:hypothetical protein n=1 Tax=Mariprofundus ferrooxydans TaxID=314344 RepID=UPI0014308D76|nr:hypothetical protein [Mariprofundus ferrooxydans]